MLQYDFGIVVIVDDKQVAKNVKSAYFAAQSADGFAENV